MAVRACVIEGRGECNPAKLAEYQHIMRSLWEEISQLADFDKVRIIWPLTFALSRVYISWNIDMLIRMAQTRSLLIQCVCREVSGGCGD